MNEFPSETPVIDRSIPFYLKIANLLGQKIELRTKTVPTEYDGGIIMKKLKVMNQMCQGIPSGNDTEVSI